VDENIGSSRKIRGRVAVVLRQSHRCGVILLRTLIVFFSVFPGALANPESDILGADAGNVEPMA